MRILLDECVNHRLRHAFNPHDCQSARYAGLGGLKNGDLLAAAERLEFDVLVTVDQNLCYQQNLADRKIAVVVLRVSSTRFADLQKLIRPAQAALELVQAGQVVVIS